MVESEWRYVSIQEGFAVMVWMEDLLSKKIGGEASRNSVKARFY